MKRFLSLFISLLLLLSLGSAVKAEEAPVPIRTREDLKAIGNMPGISCRLEADIDLGKEDWTPIPFSGTLDGNGHTIYNLKVRTLGAERKTTIDGNNLPYDTGFAGLFSVLQNAVIQDLHILGADIQIETSDHCFAAILAGYMEGSRIRNCSAEGRVGLYTTNVMVGIGGMAGYGTGSIEDCSVNAELTFADRRDRDADKRCEQFMGGLLASGNADLLRNSVTIQGFDSCWGYVHNGGLIGMHYRFDKKDPNGSICDNQVTGTITFFENNPDRRAYCSPYGGELLTFPSKMLGNHEDFHRKELYNQKEELTPNPCGGSEYTKEAHPHTDTDWGYTLYTCTGCNYAYRADYQAPGHIPGALQVETEAAYDAPGKGSRSCTVCGQVLSEEEIPALIKAREIRLSEETLTLQYGECCQLSAELLPADAENLNVHFASSDPSVVAVDDSGNLTAVGKGQAEITCTSQDGFAASSCQVTVEQSFLSWLKGLLPG